MVGVSAHLIVVADVGKSQCSPGRGKAEGAAGCCATSEATESTGECVFPARWTEAEGRLVSNPNGSIKGGGMVPAREAFGSF